MPIDTATTTHAAPAPAALHLEQAAAYLAMSPEWLRAAARRREIACTRIGRSIRFRISDLDKFLDAKTVQPASAS